MKNKHLLLLVSVIAMLSMSCKHTKKAMQPGIAGPAYEIMSVMSRERWQSNVGDSIKKVFMQDMNVLPQAEPLFNMINIPLSYFDRERKTHRNVLHVVISKKVKEPKVIYKKDAWARHQMYVKMLAPNEDAFYELLRKEEGKLLSLYLRAELDRQQAYYRKNPVASIYSRLNKKFGYNMSVPKGYNLNVDTTSFVWISAETLRNSKGIISYNYPYTAEEQFDVENLIKKRNTYLRNYIPGPTQGSYMTTDTNIPYEVKHYEFNGNYAVEIRGLWKVENDFMGGPFVNLSILDTKNNRIVCVDGYVYAPQENKRNYMRQVEAVMHTLDFYNADEKKKEDK